MNMLLEAVLWAAFGYMGGEIVKPFLGGQANVVCALVSLGAYALIKRGSRQDADMEEAVPAPIKERKQVRRQARPIPIKTVLPQSVIEAAKQLAVTGSGGKTMRTRRITLFLSVLLLAAMPFLAVPDTEALVIGTSVTQYAIAYPFQRKSFHANGLDFIFFTDSYNLYCRAISANGAWVNSIAIRPCTDGWSKFVTRHESENGELPPKPILYRKGIANSDGSLTWVLSS
jgi:hypothetical protein